MADSEDDYVDDFYFSALEAADEEPFPVSDEKYANALQFQEAVMASVISSIPKMPPPSRSHSSPRPTPTSSHEGEPSSFVCGICMEPKEISDTFRNGSCSHRFCIDCTRQHLTVRIQENASGVQCPELGCNAKMDPEWCQGILPGQVFERWSSVLSESAISAKNRVYCPYKDCSALFEDEGSSVIVEAECPNCNRLFCAKCKAPWHADLACEEYQVGERGTSDILLKRLAKEKKWARCPKCKFYVEKVEGCHHITCRCNFQFCYQCGDAWAHGHHNCQG